MPDESVPELTNSTLYAIDGKINDTIFDFEIKNVLGRGNFGKVFLVQKKTTGEVFAMK